MKVIVTGSLGNISKPLTQELVKKGHQVTVISSKAERQKDIEANGAKAAIGTMEDAGFLSATFKGADVVYVMESLAPDAFFDPNVDVIAAITEIGKNYKQAIEQSGVKRVVHLSSIGADKGVGLLRFHYNVENILRELPEEVFIKFVRPVGFYTYMYTFIQTIKSLGAIVGNYRGDEKEPWVSPKDIAAVIAEEIEKPFNGKEIRYIASDEVSPNEIAEILGKAIGNSDLKWLEISDEQFLNGLLESGMNPQTAQGFVEMNAARRGGRLYEDYFRHRPILGKVKLKDFAKDFAVAYNQQ
ncbi:MAG: NmrA family NAD(P)-binding protein [Nostoc sp.]|uniref:NmrA family NAD(P)-binding protein n=1 Tax=Nostoc sp. TaxID=1180 RepID=UPI002FFA32EC